MRPLLLFLVLAAAVPAFAGDLPAEAPPARKATTIAEAWGALAHAGGHACAERDLIFDYGNDGGMRNFFCRALTVFSWKTFLSLAPAKPFRAGPHKGTKLKLDSERDFGRYDPRFVRWAVDTLVPGATDTALRAQTQGVYDAQMRALARTYWEVQRAVASDPAWRDREVIIYLRAADDRSVKWNADVVWFYHDTLGTADADWGGYDPNHVRSATMWWLRREKDGTAALWREGLEKLLRTYDDAWLRAHARAWTGKLPQRPAPRGKPEYE